MLWYIYIFRFAIATFGSITQILNEKECSLLINSNILSAINSIINALDLAAKRPIEKINTKQIIYEEDLNKIKCLRGADIMPYLKLGTRVIRGEDWKWDSQVFISIHCINNIYMLLIYWIFIGWFTSRWRSNC